MTRPGPVVLLVLMQAVETPPFSSWAQLAIFLIAVGMTVSWIWKFVKERRTGPAPNGVAKVVGELRLTLEELNGTLAVLTEKVANLPTKLDLQKAAEDSRHHTRNVVAGAQAVILEAIDRKKGGRR